MPCCPACGKPSLEARCAACGAALRAGRYVISRVLARSAHSRVYFARSPSGVPVALKEMVFALVPTIQQLNAFDRECEVLRQLSHRQIPRFVSSFHEGEGPQLRWYLAQEFVPGETLAERLVHHRFSEREVVGMLRELLSVLSYLHELSPKVIHRDIKPANIIFRGDGRYVLVDFGVARDLANGVTHGATLVGTFGYIPPEQLGGTVDDRSDLYAVGATAIHLLARMPPDRLIGPNLSIDFQKRLNASKTTKRFLSKLVAPRPVDRFPSARAALAALEKVQTSPLAWRAKRYPLAEVLTEKGARRLALRWSRPVRALSRRWKDDSTVFERFMVGAIAAVLIGGMAGFLAHAIWGPPVIVSPPSDDSHVIPRYRSRRTLERTPPPAPVPVRTAALSSDDDEVLDPFAEVADRITPEQRHAVQNAEADLRAIVPNLQASHVELDVDLVPPRSAAEVVEIVGALGHSDVGARALGARPLIVKSPTGASTKEIQVRVRSLEDSGAFLWGYAEVKGRWHSGPWFHVGRISSRSETGETQLVTGDDAFDTIAIVPVDWTGQYSQSALHVDWIDFLRCAAK